MLRLVPIIGMCYSLYPLLVRATSCSHDWDMLTIYTFTYSWYVLQLVPINFCFWPFSWSYLETFALGQFLGHVFKKFVLGQVLGQIYGKFALPKSQAMSFGKICFGQVLGQVHGKFAVSQVLGHATWKISFFWSSSGLGTWKIFPFPSPRPCHLEKIYSDQVLG